MRDDNILNPWYAINDDPAQYNTFSCRLSGAEGVERSNASYRASQLTDPSYRKAKASFEGTDWLRAITRATRLALQGQVYPDEKSRKWYEQQKKRGLCDIYYYYDQWTSGPLQQEDRQGVICWYKDKSIRYFVFAIDDQYALSLVEKEMLDKRYQKPELFDNSERLAEVLTELSKSAGGSWGVNFLQAAQKARNGDLASAINLSQTGSGIGSWYDTPFFESVKDLTDTLVQERHWALLYLINCC